MEAIEQRTAYPLSISGQYQVGRWVDEGSLTPEEQALYPTRRWEGVPKVEKMVVQGITLKLGQGGMNSHVSEALQVLPLEDMGVKFFAVEKGGYERSGGVAQAFLMPTVILSEGPVVQKNEGVTWLEGAQIQAPHIDLKAKHLHLPDAVTRQVSTPYGTREKKTIVMVTPWQDVAHPTTFTSTQGSIRLRAEALTGNRPLFYGPQAPEIEADDQAFIPSSLSQGEWREVLGQKVSKISPEIAMVVGLAAGLATAGWGSAIINSLAEAAFGMVSVTSATGVATLVPTVTLSSTGMAIANAGFSAICSQAASSLARTSNVKQAGKELISPKSLRSLAVTMASAGLCQNIGEVLKIDMHPGLSALTDPQKQVKFTDFLQANALKSVIETPLQSLIGRVSVEEAVKGGLKNFGVNTIASYFAHHIGRIYGNGQEEMTYFEHKALHGSVGALSGWLLDHSTKGIVSGAIGSLISEVVMDECREVARDKALDILARAEKEGRSLKDGKFQLELYSALSSELAFAKISGATVAALLGQDPSIAAHTGTNAVENNAIMLAVGIGIAAYEVYDIYKVYEQEGARAALQKVAIDGAITVATYGAGKMIFKVAELSAPMAEMVWQAYITQNPGFAQVMTKVFTPLGKGFTKAKELYLTADGALTETWAKGVQKLGIKKASNLTSAKAHVPESQSTISALDLAETKSMLAYDYSTTEAAYTLRIDPLTGKGPMAVDSKLFNKADSYKKLGAPKNQFEFWQIWESKYPGTLSAKNQEVLSKRRAPRVDEHWIKNFPEHKNYLGQIIEHHHLDHGILTVPLPKDLHRGQGNYLIWHNLGDKIK